MASEIAMNRMQMLLPWLMDMPARNVNIPHSTDTHAEMSLLFVSTSQDFIVQFSAEV